MKSLVVVYLFVAIFLIYKANCARFKPECTGTFLACPEDCTKYYLCLRGRLRIMPCPVGLHWNNRRKFCDNPADANCVEIPKDSNVQTPAPVIPVTPTPTATSMPVTEPITEPITEPVTLEPITTVTPPTEPIPPTNETKKEEMKIICYCEYTKKDSI